MTDYTFSSYTTDEEGNSVYLLHSAKSYYSVIVVKIGDFFYDGLKQPLPPDTREWCMANIRREGLKYPELKTDAETGANDCADAIRAGAKEPSDA